MGKGITVKIEKFDNGYAFTLEDLETEEITVAKVVENESNPAEQIGKMILDTLDEFGEIHLTSSMQMDITIEEKPTGF